MLDFRVFALNLEGDTNEARDSAALRGIGENKDSASEMKLYADNDSCCKDCGRVVASEILIAY